MKKKILDSFIIILTLYILIYVIKEKVVIYDTISYALNLWVNSLIPTLFPFFIISDILINYNVISYIPMIFRKIIKKIFNITNNMLVILLLSIVSGFPSNARNTRTLYDNGLISIDEANHILIFSHFSNPLFILTTIALFFFSNKEMGLILLISHYLSNFILGLIFRNSFDHTDNTDIIQTSNISFGNSFILSIKKSVDTILLICGILTIFLVMSTVVVDTLNFNNYNSMLIKGIMEITIGIEALSKLNIDIIHKAVISSCFLAFGGFSVHMQVISQITGTKIKYRYFFMGRVWQMVISGFITYIIYLIKQI